MRVVKGSRARKHRVGGVLINPHWGGGVTPFLFLSISASSYKRFNRTFTPFKLNIPGASILNPPFLLTTVLKLPSIKKCHCDLIVEIFREHLALSCATRGSLKGLGWHQLSSSWKLWTDWKFSLRALRSGSYWLVVLPLWSIFLFTGSLRLVAVFDYL